MSFEKPPLAKYLEPSSTSKAVDLVNLCRRLITEWQYHDIKPFSNVGRVYSNPPGSPSARSFQLFRQHLRVTKGLAFTSEMRPFLNQLPMTRYPIICEDLVISLFNKVAITAKEFVSKQAELTPNLKVAEIHKLYWRMRMSFSYGIINNVVGQLVKDFKKLKYDGFLLPNGKVVPFDSLHLINFWVAPKEIHLFDYKLPEDWQDVEVAKNGNPTMIEDVLRFDPIDGFLAHHFAMAFNLPEMDDEGNVGKLLIIDPTCAQFGMSGKNGELLYWGYYEDYVKAFPANKLTVTRFDACDFMTAYDPPNNDFCFYGEDLMKAALDNINSDFCGYCGEVEGRELAGIKLKKCSGCMKALYCDVYCQKKGWAAHKIDCKPK